MTEKNVTAAYPGGEGATQQQQRTTWGIYVYFAADVPDTDMQAAAWSTLRTLASVGSTDTIKITAMIDLPYRRTEYYIFPPKPPSNSKVFRWPVRPDRFLSNVNTASICAIQDFFAWSYRNCPADNIALVFWGHGYALDDFDPRRQPIVSGAGNQQGCASKKRSAKAFPGEDGKELKLLYDHTHKTVLNNADFARAIRGCTQILGNHKKIQIIGLDCCNMAMAEILSELQDFAEYAVVAETELPFQAWLSASSFEKFLNVAYPGPRDLGIAAVQDFIGSFSHSPDTYIEVSVCNLSKFAALEAAVKQLVYALLPVIGRYRIRRAIAQAWDHDVSFVPDGLIDLSSFCRLLRGSFEPVDPWEHAVINAAKEVEKAVEGHKLSSPDVGNHGGVVDYAGVTPGLTGRRISLSKGISIWFPPWIQFPDVRYIQLAQSKNYLFHGYPQIRFATATGWGYFLYRLFVLTQSQVRCRRQA
jgi:hypothetical protein